VNERESDATNSRTKQQARGKRKVMVADHGLANLTEQLERCSKQVVRFR
jgi:hypothetical protein